MTPAEHQHSPCILLVFIIQSSDNLHKTGAIMSPKPREVGKVAQKQQAGPGYAAQQAVLSSLHHINKQRRGKRCWKEARGVIYSKHYT
jgi:hypothetical protein